MPEPLRIISLRQNLKNFQNYVRNGDDYFKKELKQATAEIDEYYNMKKKIVSDLKQAERYKQTGNISEYNGLYSRAERLYGKFYIKYYVEGNHKNYAKFEWSNLIKQRIEPKYSQHGKRGDRALDKIRNPEKYMWNRRRDKEGVGVSAGFNASMRDVHYMIKPLKTKSETGASAYPSSPVKIR